MGKVSLAVAREVLRPRAMTSPEMGVVQFGAQSFDEGDEIIGNIVQMRSHPEVNTGVAKFVQYKYLINKHLHSNSTAVHSDSL